MTEDQDASRSVAHAPSSVGALTQKLSKFSNRNIPLLEGLPRLTKQSASLFLIATRWRIPFPALSPAAEIAFGPGPGAGAPAFPQSSASLLYTPSCAMAARYCEVALPVPLR